MVLYGEARGYEQYYIVTYIKNKGIIGRDRMPYYFPTILYTANASKETKYVNYCQTEYMIMIKRKECKYLMNKREFEELVKNVKNKNPKIFGLESDRKPTIQDIETIENYYNMVLPASYKEFLLQYGGGYFAFIVVYSFDNQSPFYIKYNVAAEFVNNYKLFPVIDFETGDLAGFKVYNGMCEDSIVLYNHEEKITSDTKMNLYDALGKYGLK